MQVLICIANGDELEKLTHESQLEWDTYTSALSGVAGLTFFLLNNFFINITNL